MHERAWWRWLVVDHAGGFFFPTGPLSLAGLVADWR